MLFVFKRNNDSYFFSENSIQLIELVEIIFTDFEYKVRVSKSFKILCFLELNFNTIFRRVVDRVVMNNSPSDIF